jgi:multidrug efflux pump subunit AcrA (membrane-fusion protein)
MIKRVRISMPVQVVIDALGPQEFSSRVAEIVPASDPGSRSSLVKIDLFDEKGKSGSPPGLRSGLYGKARFPVGQRQVIQVPQRAILQKGQLVGVFIVDPSNTVQLRLIKTGKPYGDRVEVLAGIEDGDRIIVEGMEKTKEGDRVQ